MKNLNDMDEEKKVIFIEAAKHEIRLANLFINTFSKMDLGFFKVLIDLKLEHKEQLQMLIGENEK